MTTAAPNRLTSIALILLATVAVVCLMLGRWQLDRAEQRRETAAILEAGRRAPALILTPSVEAAALQAWRPATAQGQWRPEWSVLLDNRNLDGKPGLWLATPLMLDEKNAVLVLRGWVERPIGNRTGQKIPTSTGIERIGGELALRVPRLFELWSSQAQATGSLPEGWKGVEPKERGIIDTGLLPRLQNLDLSEFSHRTGLRLIPAVLMQNTPDATDGLLRVWPEPSLDADKNIGYAVQWFGFAGIVIIAFVVVVWRRLRRRK
ncbi:SURF1 family protein [Zwartia sp.]|uniref:SURF1 family protein n=1 Tax=Zwartia sp. TaxID=2978004 RepID=UPI002728F434|nr:SURF1 family protein [Zwartia sp.]MDO9024105.1 SURF1 family protein [Zwartia sp.]